MDSGKIWLTLGAAMGGLGVVAGSFAAHGLDSYFTEKYAGETRSYAGSEIPASEKYLNDFKTGATYQMYHAFGLIAVGLLSGSVKKRSLDVAGWCFAGGIVFFCGSLYVLTITGMRWLGMVAPIGGLLMIAGWVALAVAACPCAPKANDSDENGTSET